MLSLFRHRLHSLKHLKSDMDHSSAFSPAFCLRFSLIISYRHQTPEYKIFRSISAFFKIGSCSKALDASAIIMVSKCPANSSKSAFLL